MKAKVMEETRNPVLRRKEILVELTHDEKGTPERLATRDFLASELDEKPENVYVVKIEGKTGLKRSLCHVEVYESKELAEKIVPKYIQTRNLPPEKREAAKKKPEKPKEAVKEKPEAKPKEAEKEKPEPKPKETVKEKPAEKAKAPEAEKPKK